VMNYDKTIQAMAKAIYEADPYQDIDWERLCQLAKKISRGVCSNEKRVCEERAKAALAALQETMPEVKPYYGDDPIKLQCQKDGYARMGIQLKNLGKEDAER